MAKGHLDEVQELRKGGTKITGARVEEGGGGQGEERGCRGSLGHGAGLSHTSEDSKGMDGLHISSNRSVRGDDDDTSATHDGDDDWCAQTCQPPLACPARFRPPAEAAAEKALVLIEGELLGEGAFSKVVKVTGGREAEGSRRGGRSRC